MFSYFNFTRNLWIFSMLTITHYNLSTGLWLHNTHKYKHAHTQEYIYTLNVLFPGSRDARANHECLCEVGMPVPDPCSPSLHLCWPQT